MRLIDADALPISFDGHTVSVWKKDLDAAPTINPYKWISVEDRLPKSCDKDPDWSETVLFRTAQGHIYSGYRYKGRPQTSFYDDSWSPPYWLDESERLDFEDEDVTHWMPFPEPPKD